MDRRSSTIRATGETSFRIGKSLCLSFPGFLDGVIARFVNSSTADGYNPYRVTREGYDWEAPDPEDPWAHFGYWGDHQLIYLLKLLEQSKSVTSPQALAAVPAQPALCLCGCALTISGRTLTCSRTRGRRSSTTPGARVRASNSGSRRGASMACYLQDSAGSIVRVNAG
jgi:hypothetical protein